MALLTLRVQTSPGQTTKNAPLTNVEVDNNFINLNTDIQTRVLRAGDTLTGKLTFVTATTAIASVNLPAGVSPTTPLNGDIWSTSTAILHRIGGVTKELAYTDSAIAFSNIAVSGQPTVSADQSGDTLTFIGGPGVTITTNATNDSVTFAVSPIDYVKTEFTATANQTVFTLGSPFTATDKIDVYLNGVLLSPSDYTATTPTITLATGAAVGDLLTVIVVKAATTVGAISADLIDVLAKTNNATHYLTFANVQTGEVTLGTATSATINPSTGVVSATDFNSTSDRDLKTNISNISGERALSIISALSGYEFDYIKSGKHGAGLIAQEVELVLPFTVTTESHKTVAYNHIIAYLVESVKHLQEEIQILKGIK